MGAGGTGVSVQEPSHCPIAGRLHACVDRRVCLHKNLNTGQLPRPPVTSTFQASDLLIRILSLTKGAGLTAPSMIAPSLLPVAVVSCEKRVTQHFYLGSKITFLPG